MGWLPGTVRHKRIITSGGIQSMCDQRARSGYDPINHYGSPGRRAAQYEPGDPGDLKTADLGQNIQRIIEVRSVYLQGLFHDLDFPLQNFVINPGSTSGDLLYRTLSQSGNNGGAGGSASNPHVPRSQEPAQEELFGQVKQEALFDFGMRLGEGTGAVIGMSLLEAAAKIYSEMATFKNAGVSHKGNDEG